MKVIYTLKQLTQGTKLWGAGNLVVMSDADAATFCADTKDPNGIDIQGKDFAKVPTIVGKPKTMAAPASADFTFATRILKAAPTNIVNPEVVRNPISAAVDGLIATFTLDFAPAKAGTLDLGDGTTKPWPKGTTTLTYTYADGGQKTAVFTPGETDGVTTSVKVTPVAPYVPKTFEIATVITGLSVDFTVTPAAAGSLAFGEGTPADLTVDTNTATYAYTADGTYDVTFTPTNTQDTPKTISVTVAAPV
jgi:hypothetical protein